MQASFFFSIKRVSFIYLPSAPLSSFFSVSSILLSKPHQDFFFHLHVLTFTLTTIYSLLGKCRHQQKKIAIVCLRSLRRTPETPETNYRNFFLLMVQDPACPPF